MEHPAHRSVFSSLMLPMGAWLELNPPLTEAEIRGRIFVGLEVALVAIVLLLWLFDSWLFDHLLFAILIVMAVTAVCLLGGFWGHVDRRTMLTAHGVIVGTELVAFVIGAVVDAANPATVALAMAAVVAIPLAFVALAFSIVLWLAVLGYLVAGWLGAFIGVCTTLILFAIRNQRQ